MTQNISEPTTGEYEAINFDGLERRANYRTIAYREDILHILERKDAAAILYQIIYRWETEIKRPQILKEIERRKQSKQPPLTFQEVEDMMWVYMSYNDFVRESGGAVAYNTVIRMLDYMIDTKKVVQQRPNHDPRYPDYEYRINRSVVKELLKALPAEPVFTPKVPKKKEKSTQEGIGSDGSTQEGTPPQSSTQMGTESTQEGIATTQMGTEVYPNGGTSHITTHNYSHNYNTEDESIPAPESHTPTISPPGVGDSRADYPLITFADCLNYLQQQGVPARGDDAVQIMIQARTLYAHKHPRYEYRARPGLSEHPDDQLPGKTEAFIEKLREWRIEDEQPEEDITQAETVKVPAVSKQNTSTIPPAQASPPQSEQAALEQTAQQNHSAVTPCSADDIKNRRFQMATPDVPLPETCSVPASTTGVSLANKPALQSQSGVNSRATHGTTNLFSQTPEKPDVPPSGVPPTKGKAKKQAEPKTETPKSPPVEPPSDMAWGTRKCLLWFDYWRGGILIGTYKNSQASTCAKGLAAQFDEQTVIGVRELMEADPYYIGKGGCDVCDVANNIHKYLKRKQQTKNPAQSTNVAQSQPITNIRELVRQREARLTAAAVQVGV